MGEVRQLKIQKAHFIQLKKLKLNKAIKICSCTWISLCALCACTENWSVFSFLFCVTTFAKTIFCSCFYVFYLFIYLFMVFYVFCLIFTVSSCINFLAFSHVFSYSHISHTHWGYLLRRPAEVSSIQNLSLIRWQ
jgi:hypothetical protein